MRRCVPPSPSTSGFVAASASSTCACVSGSRRACAEYSAATIACSISAPEKPSQARASAASIEAAPTSRACADAAGRSPREPVRRAGRRRRSRRSGPCAAARAAAARCRSPWPPRARATALRHPREQRAEHATRHAAVVIVAAGRDALLDLVDPDDRGRHALRRRKRLAKLPLGFAVPTCCRARRGRGAAAAHASVPAIAFAARLLPAPCTPSISTPRGGSSGGAPASPTKTARRCASQP